MDHRLRLPSLLAAASLVGVALVPPAFADLPLDAAPDSASVGAPLTNLDHIDWLGDAVAPPAQARHTTYDLADDPEVGLLWTYADRQADGTYVRVGGGVYDPESDTWGQGAFNADDVARAAVVYLRHWQQTGAAASRERAYQLLRGLTYLQTATGPNAGNVVLWMQPDGTLNRSADPPELPDPSDSGPSYWLARTIWALGEGYTAFADDDPAFAAFLAERLDLAVDAVDRQVLIRYGEMLDVDGDAVPAWLIADGADATGEALLGLAPYVDATGDVAATAAMTQLAEGVARMGDVSPRNWSYGAIRPWALARSFWHGWGGLAPAGLAAAADTLDRDDLLLPARRDVAAFTPHLLIATGPVNGWAPTPVDRTQIAYGAQSRVGSVLALADVTGEVGLERLAGVAASWFSGNNWAGEPMYDPATGRTYDGISGDGTVNFNSGAESTIHGLLTMLELDARPAAAAVAQVAGLQQRETFRLLEAESGTLAGAATVYTPESTWTGESQWSGTGGVRLDPTGTITLTVPGSPESVLMPVVLRDPDAGRTRWSVDGVLAGKVGHDRVGEQGDSPAPGLLDVDILRDTATTGGSVTVAGRTTTAYVDALLVQPLVERIVLSAGDGGTALLRSFAGEDIAATVELPGSGTAVVEVFGRRGHLVSRTTTADPSFEVTIPKGGFALATR